MLALLIFAHPIQGFHEIFGKDTEESWRSKQCGRIYSQPQDGEETIRTYGRASDDATNVNNIEQVLSTKDILSVEPYNLPFFSSNDNFWVDDEEIEEYMVQCIATYNVGRNDIVGSENRIFQDLCYSQYVLYHHGYEIVLDFEPVTEDEVSFWQFTSSEGCGGRCLDEAEDQFPTEDFIWGGDYAAPYWEDSTDGGDVTESDTDYKFMVVGDSISHGMSDDWTWRWRLDVWFQDNAHDGYSFVGPWCGTHGPYPPTSAYPPPPLFDGEPWSTVECYPGSYARGVPARFAHSGHAARWGRQAVQTRDTIYDWVSEYQPDFLLVLLGFNDLAWLISGPDDLLGDIELLVEHAREAKSDIRILIGNVVDRTRVEGREDLITNTVMYNELLRTSIETWFRWHSPIAYVDVNANYDCGPDSCPDGYDGLHPNAMGEYHIAQAFADVLKESFGITGGDFTVPSDIPAREVGTPTGVVSSSLPEGLYTTWDEMPNNRGYSIRSRVVGMTDWWSSGKVYPNTWASLSTWVSSGQEWEFQVAARTDDDATSDWSESVTVTANVAMAPGPGAITVEPSGDGIRFSWTEVAGYDVNRYATIVWDQDTDGACMQIAAASGGGAFVGGLNAGNRYSTWVSTWINMESSLADGTVVCGGLPKGARDVMVGGGQPSAPANLVATNTATTTVELIWDLSANATGYEIYVRRLLDHTGYSLESIVDTNSGSITSLFPGTWHYELCVVAFNGNLTSDMSSCVIPSAYPGDEKRGQIAQDDKTDAAGNNSLSDSRLTMEIDFSTVKMLQQLMHNTVACPLQFY